MFLSWYAQQICTAGRAAFLVLCLLEKCLSRGG